MIDLTQSLPRYFLIGDRAYPIKTDFREWIKVGCMLNDGCTLYDLAFIFEADIPEEDFTESLYEFYQSENATPRISGEEQRGAAPLFDYILDGEYIYASFIQAYGIDLIDIEYLHYHKFKALFSSLPDDTKLSRIIGYRAYDPSEERKKPDAVQRELKRIWSLPVDNAEQEEFLKQVNEIFYGA